MLCYQPLQPASIEMTRERERIYSMMCSTHKPCPLECNNDLLCMLGETLVEINDVVADEPDEIREVRSSSLVANKFQHVLILNWRERKHLNHSLAHSFIHQLIHSLTHSLPLTHSSTHSPHSHSLTHSSTHSLTHLLTHSFTHSLPRSLARSPTHSPTHSPIHSSTRSLSSFSFFLEKNMQSYFFKTLSQRCGRYVVLQLLQTLSILFDNIRNETSICECRLEN